MKVVYVGQVISEENKDNNLYTRSAGNVVYKRYMNCRHRL